MRPKYHAQPGPGETPKVVIQELEEEQEEEWMTRQHWHQKKQVKKVEPKFDFKINRIWF